MFTAPRVLSKIPHISSRGNLRAFRSRIRGKTQEVERASRRELNGN